MHNFLSIAVMFLPIPVFAQLCGSVSAGDRPNIVIFLADDLGYVDIGVNGCRIYQRRISIPLQRTGERGNSEMF